MEQEDFDTAHEMPMNMGGDRASIIEKINPDEIVELIRMRLMGKTQDRQTGKWKTNPNLINSSISEIGAWDITNLILSVSNANTSLSKLDDKTIRKRAYSLMEKSVGMMLCNWREYKITNTAQLGYIAEIVFSITFITLKMADAEGIRKMITSMYSENRSINEMGTVKSGRQMFRGRGFK